MPPVQAGHHLLGYLWEIGPTMPAGSGVGAITQQEIAAWQDNTGVCLQSWEARVLRSLSAQYLSAWHEAQEPDAPPPWRPAEGPSAKEITSVAMTLRERIRRMANQ